MVMFSVSYAGKNAYSAGKTSGVLRGGASRSSRCYVLAHCGGGVQDLGKPADVILERYLSRLVFSGAVSTRTSVNSLVP